MKKKPQTTAADQSSVTLTSTPAKGGFGPAGNSTSLIGGKSGSQESLAEEEAMEKGKVDPKTTKNAALGPVVED